METAINDAFAQPLSWSRLKKWLSGEREKTRDTAEQNLGRAIHARVLQPDEYARRLAIYQAPVNPRTGSEYGSDTKAAQTARAEFEASLTDNAIVLSLAESVRVNNAADALQNAGFYVAENESVETHVERVVDVNGVDVTLHGYIDKYSVGGVDGYTFANVVELKTTSKPVVSFGGDDKFRWDARELGYLHQLAFYSILLWRDVTNAKIVVAETTEPFRVASIDVKYSTLKRCQDDILEVFLPAWLEGSRPTFNFEY